MKINLKIFLAIAILLIIPSFVFAQDVYTYTFEKEGLKYVTTKTITESLITIETKVYDSQGNLIKTDVKTKIPQPTPVKEIVYPEKDSVPPSENSKIVTPTVKPLPTSIPAKTPTSVVKSELPIVVNEETGELEAERAGGLVSINQTPPEVIENAKTLGIDVIDEIKLIEEGNRIKYTIEGNKVQKFLGVFEIYLPTSLVYDAEGGTVEKIEQSNWVKFADILSF